MARIDNAHPGSAVAVPFAMQCQPRATNRFDRPVGPAESGGRRAYSSQVVAVKATGYTLGMVAQATTHYAQISSTMRSTCTRQSGRWNPNVPASRAVFRRELRGRRAGVG